MINNLFFILGHSDESPDSKDDSLDSDDRDNDFSKISSGTYYTVGPTVTRK